MKLKLLLIIGLTVKHIQGTMKFNSNGKFKIVQFTDPHMGVNDANDILT